MNSETKSLLQKISKYCEFEGLDTSDVNSTNDLGETALHWAVWNNDYDAVNILIKDGAAINKQGEMGVTPLIAAIQQNDEKIIELLLANGANPKIKSEFGFNTIEEAKSKCSLKIQRLLKKYA